MSGLGNGPGRYTVRCSGAIIASIHLIRRRAWDQGRGKAVTRALRKIIDQLENDPWNFGEPAYGLPSLRMQVRTAIVRPLAVDFGVCEDRTLVFIKGVKLLSAKG
jgi:hypothetical protein